MGKDFKEMSLDEKKQMIEEVLDKEIRPFIAMDKGGIELVDVKDTDVYILYQGACVGCPAAMGTTLSAIQEVLRKHVHPDIVVIPK